jgi:hypothetical protein
VPEKCDYLGECATSKTMLSLRSVNNDGFRGFEALEENYCFGCPQNCPHYKVFENNKEFIKHLP